MKIVNFTVMILGSILISTMALGQKGGVPVNYLNTPVSLLFDNSNYHLSWTSHPSQVYYKQEYLQNGETIEKFKSMLMLEVLNTKIDVRDAAANKITELERMKAGNPYISYETSYDAAKQEQILDFIITANSRNGKDLMIAERNVYRYTSFLNQKGEKVLLLVAISTRSYGTDSKRFVEAAKSGKAKLLTTIKEFKIPVISIKDVKSV